jgi:hypothetical protein
MARLPEFHYQLYLDPSSRHFPAGVPDRREAPVIPFPTAVVAEYLQTSAATTAVEFYCGSFFVNSVVFLSAGDGRVPPEDPLRRSYRWGPPGCLPFSPG